jgi:hypothetical protein
MISRCARSDESTGAGTGAGSVCLKIADITIALRSAAHDLPLQVIGPMGEFVVTNGAQPDVTISVDWSAAGKYRGGKLLFDSGSVWRLYELADALYEFRFAAPFSGWRTYKVARFSRDFKVGEILCQPKYFAPGERVYPLEYPLDEVLISNLLACGRGIEVHACGLSDRDGRGYLFVGQSGAGKSTIASLWARAGAGVRVLSDERIILRWQNGRIWMYGTPWHGCAGLARPDSAPLTRTFFLARGTDNELVPQNRAESAARLFACSFPPFYSLDGLAFILEFLEKLTRLVTCDELRFIPDDSAVQFVREQ